MPPTMPIRESKACRLLVLLLLLSPLLAACEKPVPPPEGMTAVPGGEFIMGSDKVDTEDLSREFGMRRQLYQDEHPRHKRFLPLFYIDLYEVTNAQYKLFVDSTSSPSPRNWPNGMFPVQKANHPVTSINWFEASGYCAWKGKRLPAEPEWEKAARGTDGREYPWGNDYRKDFANMGDSGIGDTLPVGKYENGKSPFGAYDMTGNVWEWTSDWYLPYPGSDLKSNDFGQKNKVLRGGSYGGVGHYTLKQFYRIPYRFFSEPQGSFQDVGFRCAKSPGK